MVDFMLEFDAKKTCHFDKKRVVELMQFFTRYLFVPFLI